MEKNNLKDFLKNVKKLDTKVISQLKNNFLAVIEKTKFTDYDVISLTKNNNTTKMYYINRGVVTENNKENLNLRSNDMFISLFNDIFLNDYELLNNGDLSKIILSFDTSLKDTNLVNKMNELNLKKKDDLKRKRDINEYNNNVNKKPTLSGGNISTQYNSAFTHFGTKNDNQKREVLSAALAAKLAYLDLEPRYTNDNQQFKLNTKSPGYLNYTTIPGYAIQYNDANSKTIPLFINNDNRTTDQTSSTVPHPHNINIQVSTGDELYKKYRNYEHINRNSSKNYFYKGANTGNQNKNHVVIIAKWKHNITNLEILNPISINNVKVNFNKMYGQIPPGQIPPVNPNENQENAPNQVEDEDNAQNIGMVRYYLIFDMNINKFILSIRGTDFGGESNLNNWFINTQFALRSLRAFYREHRGTTVDEANSAMECCYNFVFDIINESFDEIVKTTPSISQIADFTLTKIIFGVPVPILVWFGRPLIEVLRQIIFNKFKPQLKVLIRNLIEIELPITEPTPEENIQLLRLRIFHFIDQFLTDLYETTVTSVPNPNPLGSPYNFTFIELLRKYKPDIPENCNDVINHPNIDIIINYLTKYIESDYLGNTINFTHNVYAQSKQIINELGFEDDTLIISGHSLGGGLTQITSALNNAKGYGFNPVGTRIAISNLQSNGTSLTRINFPSAEHWYLPYLAYKTCWLLSIIKDTFDLTFNNFVLVDNPALFYNNTENYIVDQDLIHKIKLTSDYAQIHIGTLYELSVPEYRDCYKDSFFMIFNNLDNEFKTNVTSFHGIDGLLLMISKIMYGQNILLDDFNTSFIIQNLNTNNSIKYWIKGTGFYGGNDKYYKKYLKYKSKYLELLDKSKNI